MNSESVASGNIFIEREVKNFDTVLSAGQYSHIEAGDPLYEKVVKYLNELKPKFFRGHNNYDDEYCDSSGKDSFHIVEPYPPGHPEYRWDFSELDKKVEVEISYSDASTYIYNIRTCPTWMLDKTKFSPRFPNTTGVPFDKTYKQVADFCARVVAWYNKGGFVDENGSYHHSGHYYNIKYWEILNEQDEGESGIYIKSGKEYARLFDAVSSAIKAVDPDVYCGGPCISSVPTETNDTTYIKEFLENVKEKVDFVSFHYYGDQSGLIKRETNPIYGTEGGFVSHYKKSKFENIDARYFESIDEISGYFGECFDIVKSYGDIPIMITETNVTLSNDFDMPLGLGEFSQGTFGTAWFAYLFKMSANKGINVLNAFQFYSPAHRSTHLKNNLSLINNISGEPQMVYWLLKGLSEYFEPGGVIVENSFKGDIEVLSVVYREKNELSLLVINKSVPDETEKRITGNDIHVNIELSPPWKIDKNSIKITKLDGRNKTYAQSINPAGCFGENRELKILMNGYGVALIRFNYTE